MYQLLSERLLFGGTHGDCSSQHPYHVFPVHTSAATSELTFTVFPSLTSYTTLCLPSCLSSHSTVQSPVSLRCLLTQPSELVRCCSLLSHPSYPACPAHPEDKVQSWGSRTLKGRRLDLVSLGGSRVPSTQQAPNKRGSSVASIYLDHSSEFWVLVGAHDKPLALLEVG